MPTFRLLIETLLSLGIPLPQRNSQKGVAVAEALAKLDPELADFAEALAKIARLELLQQRFTCAQKSAERAAEVNSQLRIVKTNLAHAYLFNGQFEKAKSLYLEVHNFKDLTGQR